MITMSVRRCAESWIAEFMAVGGSCDLVGEHLHTTYSFVGTSSDERREAARLVAMLAKDPRLLDAMRATMSSVAEAA